MRFRLTGFYRNRLFWCGALIFALSASLYLQTARFDFVEWDDPDYVYTNPAVMKGLCGPSLRWAFTDTATSTATWIPLTFVSHMADVSLFGVNAGPMHLHNAVLHGINSVLLFVFLLLFLNRLFPSRSQHVWIALLATLFWSLHPLRVESVAWVASRKDVLCLFWYLIGTMVYMSDLTRDCARRKSEDWKACATAGCFLLAFMAKPTAVVFPATAMLLEYALTRRITWRRNELLLYSVMVFIAVTICTQDIGRALDKGSLGFVLRITNAIAAIGQYVSTTLWPQNLACFYPYEVPIPWRRLIPGCLFVLGVCYFFFRHLWPFVTAHPAVSWQTKLVKQTQLNSNEERDQNVLGYAVGIIWFVVALLPVVGLLQVGGAACADRYTYLSGVGLAIMLAVFFESVSAWWRTVRLVLYVIVISGLAALYVVSYRQVGVWRNQITLFSHAERAVKGNHLAYTNVGTWYFNAGRYAEALEQYVEGAKILLTEQAEHNLASALSKLAGDDYTNDVFLHPIAEDDPLAAMKYHALGLVACWRKMDDLAETYLRKSLSKNSGEYQVWEQLGFICEKQGRMQEAEEMFRQASALNPSERGLRAKLRQIQRQNRDVGRR